MRRNYDPETLSKYKYPNLVAEFMESGYSICTLSEHMGLGRCEENDALVNVKIFGDEEIFYMEAVRLARLFGCTMEYLFSHNLEKVGDMPVAYYRHYESNKRMEKEMVVNRLSREVREVLEEKPYLAGFMKHVLSWDKQQLQRVTEMLWNLS